MTDAIQHLFDRLKAEAYPTAQLGGIYANKPGYHNRRDNLPGSDYSVQRPDDQAGNGQWAAGLDVTLHNPADMVRLTQRLIDLTLARDARIQVVREFFGTTDGRTVVGLDVRDVRWITSDPSHLWHEHYSIYRRWAGAHAAMDALADAILDVPTTTRHRRTALTDQQHGQFLQKDEPRATRRDHHHPDALHTSRRRSSTRSARTSEHRRHPSNETVGLQENATGRRDHRRPGHPARQRDRRVRARRHPHDGPRTTRRAD